ncbi:MAG: hypothetical protein JRE23_03315 [Deltaproteobacteria bacterium]|nr:hypothetical protein [Deltaproteobacteria bacterium]
MKTKYPNVFVNPDVADVGMHRAVMAFDLDSVLNTMGRNLRGYIEKQYGMPPGGCTDVSAGWEKFHFAVPGIEDKEIGRLVNDFVMNESPSLLTTPYMREVMAYVHDRTNAPVTVVTARWHGAVGVTKRWLEEALGDIPFIAYIVNGLSFVDDRWKTCEGLISKIPWPVMFRRPWNCRPVYLPVIKIDDLRDIIPLLNILTGEVPTAWPDDIPHPHIGEEDYVYEV